ncbi:hypothetical protein AMTRI_Chr10g7710 [Amborella trichopoda]
MVCMVDNIKKSSCWANFMNQCTGQRRQQKFCLGANCPMAPAPNVIMDIWTTTFNNLFMHQVINYIEVPRAASFRRVCTGEQKSFTCRSGSNKGLNDMNQLLKTTGDEED